MAAYTSIYVSHKLRLFSINYNEVHRSGINSYLENYVIVGKHAKPLIPILLFGIYVIVIREVGELETFSP